jgi:hypothetical protein
MLVVVGRGCWWLWVEDAGGGWGLWAIGQLRPRLGLPPISLVLVLICANDMDFLAIQDILDSAGSVNYVFSMAVEVVSCYKTICAATLVSRL